MGWRFKIPVVPLFSDIIVLLGEHDEIKRYIPSHVDCFGGDDYIARTVLSCKHCGDTYTVFIHSNTISISVLAHEAVHAASMILEVIGAKGDHEDDEVLAHLVQYIVEKMEHAINHHLSIS